LRQEPVVFSKGGKYRLHIKTTGASMETKSTISDILSRKQAAQFLGICLTTLDRLDIPRTRVRHRVLYKRDVLNKWIDSQTENGKKGKV